MTKKTSFFWFLAALIYFPLVYMIFIDPSAGRPHLIPDDWRPEDLWVFVSPLSGFILWIWSLWDWGNRSLKTKWHKFAWLFLLLSTLYLGSTVYFLSVGLKERASI